VGTTFAIKSIKAHAKREKQHEPEKAMNPTRPVPHTIKASIPDRYPRGWFCVGASHEFTTDKPIKMDYFGQFLVAYRGEAGEMHVLDAYCPHMGANLASGHVNGESIVCPFHAWSWGPDGVCDHIPYDDRIPRKAVVKSWSSVEVNDLVYVWHDPDGGEPIAEQSIPADEVVSEPGWTPWIIERVHVNVHARELIDNMADKAHFGPVHGLAKVTHFSNIAEGHKYTQLMNSEMDDHIGISEATYHGPGYMLHHNTTLDPVTKERTSRSMTLVMNVPTGPASFEFIAGWKFELPVGCESPDAIQKYCDEMREMAKQPAGLFSDLAIWKDKIPIDNPVLCSGDGPVTKLREWYSQFLVPLDQVPDSIRERKVYDKSELIEWQTASETSG
jgi:3-ketosteroid 9alpha-monooxygenase subunit A